MTRRSPRLWRGVDAACLTRTDSKQSCQPSYFWAVDWWSWRSVYPGRTPSSVVAGRSCRLRTSSKRRLPRSRDIGLVTPRGSLFPAVGRRRRRGCGCSEGCHLEAPRHPHWHPAQRVTSGCRRCTVSAPLTRSTIARRGRCRCRGVFPRPTVDAVILCAPYRGRVFAGNAIAAIGRTGRDEIPSCNAFNAIKGAVAASHGNILPRRAANAGRGASAASDVHVPPSATVDTCARGRRRVAADPAGRAANGTTPSQGISNGTS